MGTITCICEKTFEVEVPDFIDLTKAPDVCSQIINGTYLLFTCPHCGHLVKPDAPMRIVDATKGIDIFHVPERERSRYLLGLTNYNSDGRIVIGYAELVERLRIYSAQLNDSAVELIKYYLLVKAGPGAQPEIFFKETEDEALVFEIAGLRENEVGRVKIQREVYEKAENELPVKQREEPYSTILEPPYVSICKVEIEEN